MAKAVCTLYGDDATVYGTLVITQLRKEWPPYYMFPLRSKVLLWQQDRGKGIALSLPDELEQEKELHPFLFVLYGQSLLLLVVGKHGGTRLPDGSALQ
ncbi:hypothetical protein BBJ28_00002036 [Nothophytophthora sp. Chile5]|nr:hypothetical protein BBJ28_00002036 [Nothophytophthora sp. Chile5]